jgi:hypothetical protein
MDAGKLTQMKMQAANNYKSHWKPRDASEVTMRNQQLVVQNNSTTHRGPVSANCTAGCPSKITDVPIGNFTTSYTADVAFMRAAGSVCYDPNWSSAGGVYLKSCAEVSTIGFIPLNPVLGTQPCGNNSNTYHRVVPSASNLSIAYTGSANQVPTNGRGQPNNYPIGPLHYRSF